MAGGNAHAAGKGALRSEVARVIDNHHSGITGGQGCQDLPSVVGAMVVDKNDFVVNLKFFEDRRKPLMHNWHRRRIKVTSDDRAKFSGCQLTH